MPEEAEKRASLPDAEEKCQKLGYELPQKHEGTGPLGCFILRIRREQLPQTLYEPDGGASRRG